MTTNDILLVLTPFAAWLALYGGAYLAVRRADRKAAR